MTTATNQTPNAEPSAASTAPEPNTITFFAWWLWLTTNLLDENQTPFFTIQENNNDGTKPPRIRPHGPQLADLAKALAPIATNQPGTQAPAGSMEDFIAKSFDLLQKGSPNGGAFNVELANSPADDPEVVSAEINYGVAIEVMRNLYADLSTITVNGAGTRLYTGGDHCHADEILSIIPT